MPEKPTLLRITRDKPHETFVAVFQINTEGTGEISVPIPSGTAEEDMVAVARDHFWRLTRAIADETAGWALPDNVRQRIDPDRNQPAVFENRSSARASWPGSA